MGKYMKKSKIVGDVALMEVPTQSSLGVRTRAKTHALQTRCKPLSSSSSSSSSSPVDPNGSSFSYLQLRSRRLKKTVVGNKKPQPPTSPPKSHGKCCGESPNSNCRGMIANSRARGSSVKSVSVINEKEGHFLGEIAKGSDEGENADMCIEGSFGENILEFEGRDRSTGESKPCSLIRDSNTIAPHGSTPNQILYEPMQGNIPTAYEMEEFFAFAEKQQHRIFMEKYNFDIVNDVPLPGRYKWVQVLH